MRTATRRPANATSLRFRHHKKWRNTANATTPSGQLVLPGIANGDYYTLDATIGTSTVSPVTLLGKLRLNLTVYLIAAIVAALVG